MNYVEVSQDVYIEFLRSLSNKYVYMTDTMSSRTSIVREDNLDDRIAYRHIPECFGDTDRYFIREDILDGVYKYITENIT